MRILKRIVFAPSFLNRASIHTKVIPTVPDVMHYESRLCSIADYSPFYEVLNSQKYKTPKHVWYNALLPKEIGYIVEHKGKMFGVPIGKLKALMKSFNVSETEHSGDEVYAIIDGTLSIYNDEPCTEESDVVFIYYNDPSKKVQAMLPIDISFRVYTANKQIKTIFAKGSAMVDDVKLINEELLPVADGVIVDVSGFNLHNGERVGAKL